MDMKKIRIGVFVFLVVLCGLSQLLQAQTDSAGKANYLISTEQLLCDALPWDSTTWGKYLDHHWYAITEDGSGTDRKAFLEGFSPFSKGISGNIQVIKPVCLFHGDIAVVHYVADENETVFGQKLHTSYAVMDTWYKTGDSWKMLSMQIFEIPQLPLPAISNAVDIKKFIGTYEMTENKTAIISLSGDTLYRQKNNHAREILYPETENVFFTKGNTRGRILFIKDLSGQMVMKERRNGQDLVWKMKTEGQ
jgi:hypothetical protein